MQSLGGSLGDDVANRRTKPDAPAARIDAYGLADASGEIMPSPDTLSISALLWPNRFLAN